MKCQHEVPCTCDEYLNRLSKEELINLRVEFGKVPCVDDKFNSFRRNKWRAENETGKVNKVLGKKFGLVIV